MKCYNSPKFKIFMVFNVRKELVVKKNIMRRREITLRKVPIVHDLNHAALFDLFGLNDINGGVDPKKASSVWLAKEDPSKTMPTVQCSGATVVVHAVTFRNFELLLPNEPRP